MNTYDFFKYQRQINLTEKEHNDIGWNWESDSNMWDGFMVWLVFSGKGKIKLDLEEYNIARGDLFLFDLNCNHICTQDPNNPMSVYMVYFSIFDDGVLSKKMINGEVPRLYNTEFSFCQKIFENICAETEDSPYQKAWFDTVLAQLFYYPDQQKNSNSKINKIYSEIILHPDYKFTLDELAKQSGYSKSQLVRLFKKHKGITPYDHVINAKINMAKNMLIYSERSVSEISDTLYYNDINHFSKQFKKKTGLYPTEFKKLHHKARK